MRGVSAELAADSAVKIDEILNGEIARAAGVSR
jgi:hypothetical protein